MFLILTFCQTRDRQHLPDSLCVGRHVRRLDADWTRQRIDLMRRDSCDSVHLDSDCTTVSMSLAAVKRAMLVDPRELVTRDCNSCAQSCRHQKRF